MMLNRWCVGFLLLLSLVSVSGALDTNQPLILIRAHDQWDWTGRLSPPAGDLWEWTGGPMLRQKTQWGYNRDLVLSPLNNEVAYNSLPQIAIDYFESQQSGNGGTFPYNIWVITTETSDLAYRIADQPEDAAFMSPVVPENFTARGQPIWSPDGMQIAWAEQDFAASTSRLVVYDKTSQTAQTLVSDLPSQAGIGFRFTGVWTDKGIVMFSNAYTPDGVKVSYILFDPVTGEQKFDVLAEPISIRDVTPELRTALPIRYQGKTWLGVLYVESQAGARWQMIDLDMGQFTGETANIVGFAPGYAETSLRVIPVVPPNKTVIQYVIQQANGVNVQFSDKPNQQIMRFALSPDGEAIAYQLYNTEAGEPDSTIYVWRDGVITTVPQTEYPAIISDFVWGAITWEVGGEGPGIGAPGS